MHLNGYPLTLMVFAVVTGGFCLKLGKGARVVSLCAALAALLAVLAVPPWMDALAAVFATGPGMVVLVLLAVIGGAVYVTDHMRHHHPVRTSVFGVLAATTGVMAWAMAPELGARGSQLGPQTAAALGQAQRQIQSGHAAAQMQGSSALVILAVGAAALLFVARFIHRHHKRHPFAGARPFGAAPALPAGKSGKKNKGEKVQPRRGRLARMIGGA